MELRRNYKVILTHHSKERMNERNITFEEINNSVKCGYLKDENSLCYNGLEIKFNVQDQKIIVITLYNKTDHKMSYLEQKLFIIIKKLVDERDENKIAEILKQSYEIFNKLNTDENFTFLDFFNYKETISIVENDGLIHHYNTERTSIIFDAILKNNFQMINILVDVYGYEFYKKEGKNRIYELIKYLEEENINVVYSLKFIFDKYISKRKINELFTEGNIEKGNDLFMLSAYKGFDEICNLMLEYKFNIDVNKTNTYGENAFDMIKLKESVLKKTSKRLQL